MSFSRNEHTLAEKNEKLPKAQQTDPDLCFAVQSHSNRGITGMWPGEFARDGKNNVGA